MKRNLLYILGVVCLMASCVDEKFEETIVPTPGEDVKFSATVEEGPETRTLYGADRADTIMVKWVNGDTISVFGATGGQQKSLYTVLAQTTTSNTPNENDGQIYADDLQKTETHGVQWGTEETANFTAIYPSLGSSFPKDGQIKSTINATQNYVFPADPIADTLTGVDVDGNLEKIALWEGTHFGKDALNPSMQNAIMYARTEGVANGSTVNFLFKPFATVLKFRFMGFNSSLTDPTIYVQSITVTAPSDYAIAGDFTLDVTGSGATATATATAAGNNTNSITLNTILPGGGYLPLKKHQAVDFNVFTVPLDGLKMGGDVTKETVDGKATYTCEYPWKITIKTAQHGTFTYNVIPNVDGITKFEDGTYPATEFALAKGQIHKVKVPQLTVTGTVEWDYSKWITQIPTPVYLSELSVPGAWYCVSNEGYQKTTDLSLLYKGGIRAFNIDCRISKKNCNDHKFIFTTGLEKEWSDSDYDDAGTKSYLACAGTEFIDLSIGDQEIGVGGNQALGEGTYVLKAMQDIVALAQEHKDEYVVVVFTFAEKPYSNSGTLFGSVNPKWITAQLNKILNTSGIKEYLYTSVGPNTTIADVLKPDANNIVRNVIVKINHSTDNFYENSEFVTKDEQNKVTSSIIPSGIMCSFASMAGDSEYNLSDDLITDVAGLNNDTTYTTYFSQMNQATIYNGLESSKLTYYYHQAQHTTSDPSRGALATGIPTLGMRMDAIDSLINKATQIYDASTHNAWFQLGIGGSLDGNNPTGISDVLNPYVKQIIEQKIESDPSPVGIVLMNHATDENGNGIQLVKDIVNMNGKFYLKRAGGDVITGGGDGTDTTNPQAVPSLNAAYALVGEDAF